MQVKCTVTFVRYQSWAFGDEVAAAEIAGLVLSTFTLQLSVCSLPDRSLHVSSRSSGSPSPDEVVDSGQFASSIPTPASNQSQVTVTSLLFQPSALEGGDCVGSASGGVMSLTLTSHASSSISPPKSVTSSLNDIVSSGELSSGANAMIDSVVMSGGRTATGPPSVWLHKYDAMPSSGSLEALPSRVNSAALIHRRGTRHLRLPARRSATAR